MLFSQMHHVAIIVSDYEKAKEFYVEKLGFPILRENYRPDKGDWKLDLQFGDGELEIFAIPDAPARPSEPEARGLRHLSFRVDSVEAAIKQLEALDIPCGPILWDAYSQRHYAFFQDPEGLPLELHE